MTTTTTLAATKIDSAQAQKEVTANEAFDAFDAGFGQLTKALSDANYTLSSSTVPKEWNYGILYFTGALTAGRDIIVPTNKKTYVVINGTTGGFALTVKTSAGTGVAVSSSTPQILRCDGTNVVSLFTVPTLSTVTPNAQTGTTYTYVNADNSKLVTHTNGSAIAGTLPQAGSGGNFTNGWFMFVQNRGAGTLTITPTTSTIDGAASLALTTGQGVLICSDGTNYFTSRGHTAAFAALASVNVFTKNQSVTPSSLTSGASIAVDASLSNNFKLTLATNATLANPSNLTDGMVLNFRIKQDGTGSRTLAYGTKYKFPSGTAPVLSTAANSVDFMSCYYDSTDDTMACNMVKAFS